MTPVERPLRLGELLAETVRLYGERVWAAFGIGLVTAASFVVALQTPAAAAIVILALAFTACYAASARLAAGDGFGQAWAQVGVRLPVLLVLTLVVSVPFALAIFVRTRDPVVALVFIFFAVSWLVFVGFSIPVTMVERDGDDERWFRRLARSLHRSLALARAEFFHAVGAAAALLLVYALVGPLLARILVGFAENSAPAAFALSQIVLAPFFFLGLAVLYFEQNARAVSSRGPT